MPQYNVKGKIPASQVAEPGKALCIWGDAGWGRLVRRGKHHDSRFADELVTACVEMIRAWNPQPAPAWVTAVPSLRHPDLVPDFARRLAAALDLPFHPVLVRTDARPEQKTMANSVQQARNVDGSLALAGRSVARGPVLLVDDMVDSRWTLTVAAWLLRKARQRGGVADGIVRRRGTINDSFAFTGHTGNPVADGAVDRRAGAPVDGPSVAGRIQAARAASA